MAWYGTGRSSPVPGTAPPPPPPGGFNPQPNYSLSGTIGFGNNLTLSNTGSPFGNTGPTLVMFDDFSGGTAGSQMPVNTSGVAGSSQWTTPQGAPHSVMPFWQAGNRSGAGQCMRIYNQNSTFTPYQADLNFANTQGIYIFHAENSHGNDYTQNGNNNGNDFNYKWHWMMLNTITGGCFNMVLPSAFLATHGQIGTNIYITGNDSQGQGLPNIFVGGGGGVGTGWWDPNNWNSCECSYVGDPNNPTSANGRAYLASYNPQNQSNLGHGQRSFTDTSHVLFSNTSGANGTRSLGNTLAFPGLIQGVPSTTIIDRADAYVAIGFNANNRIMVGNASSQINCTSMMICDITSWTAGAIQFNLRQGAATSPTSNYLYWVDQSNNFNLAGQFT